jgi:hypothetical protein
MSRCLIGLALCRSARLLLHLPSPGRQVPAATCAALGRSLIVLACVIGTLIALQGAALAPQLVGSPTSAHPPRLLPGPALGVPW